MKYLTFALAKGRLAKKSMELFNSIGISCREMDENSRKLVFVNEELKLKFFLSKASDVPTYVEYGAADIGIVGRDTLLEEKRNLYEVLDLGFGKCRMAVAGTKKTMAEYQNMFNMRVATKYPQIAQDFFYHKKRQTIEIIKLNGSVELGPIVGLCDVIVDIVESGSTLRENGLHIIEEIVPISTRMVVNRVSMKMEHKRIKDIIERIKKVKGDRPNEDY